MSLLARLDVDMDTGWRLELPKPCFDTLVDLRIAIAPLQDWLPVDSDIVAAMESVAEICRKAGATVIEAAPEMIGDEPRGACQLPQPAVRHYHRPPCQASRDEELDDAEANTTEFGEADAAGISASAGDYLGWFGYREALRESYRAFFRNHDIWLCPADITNAFPHDDRPFP